jgi:hypothetical protein
MRYEESWKQKAKDTLALCLLGAVLFLLSYAAMTVAVSP